MLLIDSSAWIHWLRADGDVQVGDAVDAALASGQAAWCGMVQLELWNGARHANDKKRLRELELLLPMLSVSDKVWSEACLIARKARDAGVTAPATDILILACSRVHGAELLSADSDFANLRKALN